jgi:hypothetical protein
LIALKASPKSSESAKATQLHLCKFTHPPGKNITNPKIFFA